MLRIRLILIGICILGPFQIFSQKSFPEKCLGDWEGVLFIYKQGQLRDSIPVHLEVSKTADPATFQWKTTYKSDTHPMVKDYQLIVEEASSNTYILKEEDDVEVFMYGFDNKVYSLFETESTMLSSTYEVRKDTLVFEVNSANMQATGPIVTSFHIDYLQKARFVRENK